MLKHLALALLLVTGTLLATAPGADAKKKKKKSKVKQPSSSKRPIADGEYPNSLGCANNQYIFNKTTCRLCSTDIALCTSCHHSTVGELLCDTCVSGYYSTNIFVCASCSYASSNCATCSNDKAAGVWTCNSCASGYTLNPTPGGGRCAALGTFWTGTGFAKCSTQLASCSRCYQDLVIGRWTCTA